MLEEAFKTGRLLLPEFSSGAAENVAAAPLPWTQISLTLLFVLLFLLFLRNFLYILPSISDSIFRARGSQALESSVRVSRDRNIIALIFIIPLVLLVQRYRLYAPDFLQPLSPDAQVGAVAGVVVLFLAVRALLHLWLKPRRRSDNYMMAYRAGHTFFILLMLVALPKVGILYMFHAGDLTFRTCIYVESAVIYGLYLLRKVQILSLSCSSLTTFLYLCALELLPAALLVTSAVIL